MKKKYIDVDKIKWRIESRECKCHNDVWEEKITIVYKKDIDQMRSADVAPVVHGHWSKEMFYTEDFRGNITYGYKCSVCDELANRLQFCGNCGAKMDESEV